MTWNRTAILAAIPVAAVAVIAGVVSFSHIEALGLRTGQAITDARLLPLAVDGLIVAGSAILLAGSWLGWIGVALGVAGTLYANVMSGLPRGPLAATAAAWPAIDDGALAVIGLWLAERKRLGINGRSTLFCTLKGGPMSDRAVRYMLERRADAKHADIGKKVRPHCLRHTMAVEWAAEGKTLPDIQHQRGTVPPRQPTCTCGACLPAAQSTRPGRGSGTQAINLSRSGPPVPPDRGLTRFTRLAACAPRRGPTGPGGRGSRRCTRGRGTLRRPGRRVGRMRVRGGS